MPRNNTGQPADAASARRSRQRMLAGLVLLAVADLLFFLVGLRPTGQRARQRRDEFDRLRVEIQLRRDKVTALRTIAGSVGEARRQDGEFYQQNFLPKPTGFSLIMEEVERLARANRVRKSAVSYGLTDVRYRPDLSQVNITTSLDGDYGDIVRFINQLERSKLFLMIDTISAAGVGTG